MSETDLSGSLLAGATLAGVDLSRADFSPSREGPVTYVMTRTLNGKVETFQTRLNGANLRGAAFNSANLAGADLQGTVLTDAKFRMADLRVENLSAIDFSGADLRGANLEGALMENTNLTNANLAGAILANTDLSETTLENVNLVSTQSISFSVDLRYGQFFQQLAEQDCMNGLMLTKDGTEVVAEPVNLGDDLGREFFFSGKWRNARLLVCAADLSNVVTAGKVFRPIDFGGVNLTGANLNSTDLFRATFSRIVEIDGLQYELRANLTDIQYNHFTTWPNGFTPPPLPEPETEPEPENTPSQP